MAVRPSAPKSAARGEGQPLPPPEGEDKFRLLFERSGDAILLLDSKSFQFIDCNEATLEMLRAKSKPEVLATHPSRLSPERQPDGQLSFEKANEMIAAAIRKGSHRFEWTHRRMDGSEFPVEVLLTAAQIGDQPLIVTVWRDITERKRVETALIESENKFRLLFERSADPILLMDSRTREFIDCNRAAVELMRCGDRSGIIRQPPWKLSPEFQPDGQSSETKADKILKSVIAHGTARFEWVHRRPDGSEFPVEVVLTNVEELTEGPRIVAVWREITERKRAETKIQELNASLERRVAERTAELSATQHALRLSEERFRLAFEHAADPIILMDVHTSAFVEANEAAVRFWGAADMAQLLSSHPWEISPERQPDGSLSEEAARARIEQAKTVGANRFEWVHRRFDGTDFPAEVSLTVVQFSDRPLIVAVLRDLTERKRAEAELMRNLAKQKELSDLKSSFVSMVSHEFRTPLAVILSSAELVKNHLRQLPPETVEEQFGAICESTQHMSRMIDEVLLLGKVEGGQMSFAPAPLDLEEFCGRLVDEMQSATQRRCPMEIHVESLPGSAEGDEALLRHIFGNLLSNAVKYSPAGAPVHWHIQREGEWAILRVIDQGIGIPASDLPNVFAAFQRASNVGQTVGTGLGLVIVQRCVELHGGKISLHSEVGRGTAVTVKLPLFVSAHGRQLKRPRPARISPP